MGPTNPAPPAGEPLRVGLLLDGWRIPAWTYRVIEEVQASPSCRVALVVLRRSPEPPPGRLARLLRRRPHLVYEVYARLDRRLFRLRPDAFARRDSKPLLEGVSTLEVTPRTTRYSDALEETDLEAIRGHRLDVLLRFGFRILRGGILAAARHGVWSYHHGDSRELRGGPPGFWEVMEDRPTSGATLQVLSERLDAGPALARTWSPTHRRSVIRNRNHVYWTAAPLACRCLERLAVSGTLPAAPGEDDYRPYDGPLFRKPTNARAVPLLARFAARSGRRWLAERLSREQWFLAWHLGTGDDEGAPPGGEELFRFRPLVPPPDRYWADPFALHHDGGWWVVFEEYRYAARRGHLRALELDPARPTHAEPPRSVTVLEEPFHLSHPFLFRWQGELYLLPECAATGTVRAWRCLRFPDRWEPAAVLLDGLAGVDPTLHREGDRWWMFVNAAPPGATHAHDALHLFHAEDPLGPWRPVAGNPVKVDGRSARPAGRLFRWRGELYRPAQDCSRRYGHSVVLHRVLRLDPEGYREEPVSRIEPRWFPGLRATHTIDREGRLTVIDGMIRRWPWSGRGAGGRGRVS